MSPNPSVRFWWLFTENNPTVQFRRWNSTTFDVAVLPFVPARADKQVNLRIKDATSQPRRIRLHIDRSAINCAKLSLKCLHVVSHVLKN